MVSKIALCRLGRCCAFATCGTSMLSISINLSGAAKGERTLPSDERQRTSVRQSKCIVTLSIPFAVVRPHAVNKISDADKPTRGRPPLRH